MEKKIIKDKFNNEETEIKEYEVVINTDIKSLKVIIDSTKFEHFFLIIKDPSNKIRALITYKTRIKEYIISEDKNISSYCTKYGKLEKGIWKLIVIKPYNIDCEFSILLESLKSDIKNNFSIINFDKDKILNNEKRWYKGDFHVHSTYSDGRQSLEDIALKLKEKNIDILALTDHSILSTHFYNMENKLIIPSTEVTFDDKGHFNILGVTDFIDYSIYFKKYKNKDEIINVLLEDYKENITSLNHPFHESIPFEHDIDFKNIDFIEILNSPHEPKEIDHNIEARKFLDFLWSKNYLVYGIGGSDSHKDLEEGKYSLGDPSNYIYMNGLSFNSLSKSLKNGNSYVSRDEKLTIDILCNEKNILPGDKVIGNIEYTIESTKSYCWNLIKNGEIVQKYEGNNPKFLFKLEVEDYFRVEAYNKLTKKVEIFINPIHFKENKKKNIKWRFLLKEWNNVKRKSSNF